MAKQRFLQHAPITEALIDIRVTPSESLTFSGLSDAIDASKMGYYLKGPISQGTFAFRVEPDGQPPQTSAESAQVGLRFHSIDEKYVAQCRLNGFTLSRLPPYEDWSALMLETKKIWEIYKQRTGPLQVIRIATRFINNLHLPLQQGESFQIYLHKFADVPDEAPQALTSFFQRFQLRDTNSPASVNLTLALDTTPEGGPAPVILDVDAFSQKEIDPESTELWSILDYLRKLKNDCFFGTLTEKALELYK